MTQPAPAPASVLESSLIYKLYPDIFKFLKLAKARNLRTVHICASLKTAARPRWSAYRGGRCGFMLSATGPYEDGHMFVTLAKISEWPRFTVESIIQLEALPSEEHVLLEQLCSLLIPLAEKGLLD
jgi:hypothetical protein